MSLAERIRAGDTQAAARLITMLENGSPDAFSELDKLYTPAGKAGIIGITGAPGTGKSTLTGNLVSNFRARGKSVGVVAIDPTSALTGGALLGDRIRMQRHSADSGVFIRSLATRGWAGGLTRAALGAVRVMDAMGKDIILIETVGSGQVELDIFRAADTTMVVLTPGLGDAIQIMKAGILEVADIFVVNKADKEGADRLKSELENMLASADGGQEWKPPVILTEASNDKGTAELVDVILRHRDYLLSGGGLEQRRRERARLELLENVEGYVKDYVNSIRSGADFEHWVDDLLSGRTVPRRAAKELFDMLTEKHREE